MNSLMGSIVGTQRKLFGELDAFADARRGHMVERTIRENADVRGRQLVAAPGQARTDMLWQLCLVR